MQVNIIRHYRTQFTFWGVGAGGGSPQGYPSIPAGRGLAPRTYKTLAFVHTLSYCTYMKKPIQIRVEEEELKQWEVAAGSLGMNLSAWIREKCSVGVADNRAKGVPRFADLPHLGGGVAAAKRDLQLAETAAVEARKGKQCAHGVSKGYHCWQCRGVAVV